MARIPNSKYFMPFLLEKLNDMDLHEQRNRLLNQYIAPLAICFRDGVVHEGVARAGVVPAGVFCSLAASLLSCDQQWILQEDYVRKNYIELHHQSGTFSLTLIDTYTHVEAHIKGVSYAEIAEFACSTVKTEIENHMETICKERELPYELGFVCMSCDKSKSHFATLQYRGHQRGIVYSCHQVAGEKEICWGLECKDIGM